MSRTPRATRRPLDGVLLLDKPLGLSSNEALQRVKRLFAAERAGHTGSLDPLATGMLPVCFGEATKLCGVLLDSEKVYEARVRLGAQTATGDAEGEVIARSDPAPLTRAALEAVLPRFVGEQLQLPPMYSALKRDGRPLYALAREGRTIERAPRAITVAELRLLDWAGETFTLHVRCSKGTYIRTLAEDIAAAAGQCAHLAGLRRTAVAPFWGKEAVALAALEVRAGNLAALDRLLLSPAEALRHWPAARLDERQVHAFRQGRAVPFGGLPHGSRVAVLAADGALLGIGEGDAQGWLRPRRCLLPPR